MAQFPIFGEMSDETRAKIFEQIKGLGVMFSPLSIYNSADDMIEPDSRALSVDTMLILNAVQLAFIREYMNSDYSIKTAAMNGRQDEMLKATQMIANLSQALADLNEIDYVPVNEPEQQVTFDPEDPNHPENQQKLKNQALDSFNQYFSGNQ